MTHPIEPHEDRLTGDWILEEGRVRGDATCERVHWLTKNWLVHLGYSRDGGRWESLYRDPSDGRLWKHSYPRSEMHGGGPPQLVVLTAEAAAEKYDGVSTRLIISNFNALESAALDRIADDYPNHKTDLITSFGSCSVVKRENTGKGFYTDLKVHGQIKLPDGIRRTFGDAWISIDGMKIGICCLLHLKEGFPATLEGYSPAGEETSGIDFNKVGFKVENGPPN